MPCLERICQEISSIKSKTLGAIKKLAFAALIGGCFLTAAGAIPNSPTQEQGFNSISAWLQLGGGITTFTDVIQERLSSTGIGKVILLNSAYAGENGYFDDLGEIVRSCHSKNIEVSAGSLVFKDNWILPYLNKFPNRTWVSRAQSDNTHSPYEFCLCPGRPENQQFVIDKLVSEAMSAGADEIHIDYEVHSCYDSYCRSEFKKLYGIDPLKISVNDSRWKSFRSNQAADFMRKLQNKTKAAYPKAKISFTAPVVSDGRYTAYDTCIDYSKIAPFVDEIIPMIYTGSAASGQTSQKVEQHMNKINALVRPTNPACKVSAGIILVNERTSQPKSQKRIEQEALYALKGNSYNLVLFEYRYIQDGIAEMLKKYVCQKI